MAILRFVILAFLTAYSYSMGHQPGGLNAFGTFVSFLIILVGPAFYMLPTIEAKLRNHENIGSVALLNLFLGWTFLGWVAAYIWAFKKPTTVTLQSAQPAPPPASPAPDAAGDDLKTCPFCAEKIKSQAVKCRYCGSDLASSS